MLCAAAVLIMLMVGFFSFGWFMNNKTTSGDLSLLRSSDTDFELGAFDSSGAFDEYLTAEDGNLLTGIPTENTLPIISPMSTGGGKNEIKWLVNSDSHINNFSGENAELGIQPGSSGKLSFYVISKRDTALDITFSLDTILYDADAEPIGEGNSDNLDHIIDEDSPESKLVDGHILFFLNYDPSGLYSDRISNGRFYFSKADAKAKTAYKVDIFWIWPDVADQLLLPQNDLLFEGRDFRKIISDADTFTLKEDLIASPEKYFSDTSFEIRNAVNNSVLGSGSEGFNTVYYNTLNSKWNEADQMIGKTVAFMELQVSNAET